MADPVNHPKHYNSDSIECIEVVEVFGFNVGNALKYVWRRLHKNGPQQDLEKAIWYLRRALTDLIQCPAGRFGVDYLERALYAVYYLKDPLTRELIFKLSDPSASIESRLDDAIEVLSGELGTMTNVNPQ